MAKRVLRLEEVMDYVGLRRVTIYEKMARGEFPKPIPLGRRARGWLLEEVQEWIEEQKKLRDAGG